MLERPGVEDGVLKIPGRLLSPLSVAKPGCSGAHIETVECVEWSSVVVKNVDLCIHFRLVISDAKIIAGEPMVWTRVHSRFRREVTYYLNTVQFQEPGSYIKPDYSSPSSVTPPTIKTPLRPLRLQPLPLPRSLHLRRLLLLQSLPIPLKAPLLATLPHQLLPRNPHILATRSLPILLVSLPIVLPHPLPSLLVG